VSVPRIKTLTTLCSECQEENIKEKLKYKTAEPQLSGLRLTVPLKKKKKNWH
jgi:hypothetical protein